MGKGNFILGYGSGSIGDVTFARSKGQQVVRARNRKPNNPRSRAQMLQRTLFMGPVKFYRDAVQNLFKFAFEDKTEKESDYNAFMRHNSKVGFRLTKELYDNPGFPVIVDYTMSQGSLSTNARAEIKPNADENLVVAMNVDVAEGVVSPTTIGQLSQILIDNDHRLVGDIITIVAISKSGWRDNEGLPPRLPRNTTSPTWNIQQFVVDPTSTETLASKGWSVSISAGILSMVVVVTDVAQDDMMVAGTVIASRNTAQGLKVSTSVLRYDTEWSDGMLETLMSDEWNDIVLADWNTNEEAILKGGLVD